MQRLADTTAESETSVKREDPARSCELPAAGGRGGGNFAAEFFSQRHYQAAKWPANSLVWGSP